MSIVWVLAACAADAPKSLDDSATPQGPVGAEVPASDGCRAGCPASSAPAGAAAPTVPVQAPADDAGSDVVPADGAAMGAEDASAAASPRPAGVRLCYTSLSSGHPATAMFWSAMRAADLTARADALVALEQAVQQYPDEEELSLLLGLGYLWRVAEPAPDQELDLVGLLDAITDSETALERAYALCPTDHRITAWLAPIKTKAGTIAGDMAMVQEGLDILEVGLEHYPGFVLFSKLLVHADLPADDPRFIDAIEGVRENISYCGSPVTGLSADPACHDHPRAAHNIEGAAIFMGDAFVKAQDLETARRLYGEAKASPDYASWDYQALLDERIATLDDRAAAYQSALPLGEPVAIWQSTMQCSICHRD